MTEIDELEQVQLKDLTPRQQRFVDEYLIDLNATQAAIRSGYSTRPAQRKLAQNCCPTPMSARGWIWHWLKGQNEQESMRIL